MSQSIKNLSIDDHICIKEVIEGVAEDVLLRIVCTSENNPYGDYYFVVREYATGKGEAEYEIRYGDTQTDVEYDGSGVDQFMVGEYMERLDEGTLACIATSSIVCYNFAESASYTLARKIFALSNKELGGNNANDTSLSLGYFTTNELRTAKRKGGANAQVWTRTPSSANQVYIVHGYGYLTAISARTADTRVRPAFNLFSSCLVASEPNEDGSYNLVTDAEIPPRKAGFEAWLGDSAVRPRQIKVSCEAVHSGMLAIQVCNNYKDDVPVWETVQPNVVHDFANTVETAGVWSIAVKVECESESNITLYEPYAMVLFDEVSG